MSLLNTIKKSQLLARKNRDAETASVLTTLIGEAEMIGKNDGNRESSDAEVVAVIKKFIKNLNDTLKVADTYNDVDAAAKAQAEKQVLEVYLPKQFTEPDLLNAMREIIAVNTLSGPKAMGVLMKELKAKYEGQYDGAMASKLAKELLV